MCQKSNQWKWHVLLHIMRSCNMLRLLVAGLSPRSPGFAPGSVHVGFVMGKAAPGQVFFSILLFSAVNIPPWCSVLIYRLRNEQ
jgi:hypothetical protein